jgi:hypothetical protein
MISNTLAHEFSAGKADRAAAREGTTLWVSPTRGTVLVSAWGRLRDGSQRLAFPDDSVLILHADGREEVDYVHFDFDA